MLVAKENVIRVWPGVKGLLERAMEYSTGEYGLQYLLQELIVGRFQLWFGIDEGASVPKLKVVGVTSISTYPEKKRLRLELLAGEGLDDFLDKIDDIEQWARQFGATETEAYVRPGIAKILSGRGFKQPYSMVLRPIGA